MKETSRKREGGDGETGQSTVVFWCDGELPKPSMWLLPGLWFMKGPQVGPWLILNPINTPDGSLHLSHALGFPGGAVVKNPPASTGDMGSMLGSGRSPGKGNGNLLWYSCLENPMDRGAWQATFHGVAKSQTCLSAYTSHVPGFWKVAIRYLIRYPSGNVWEAIGIPSMEFRREIRTWNVKLESHQIKDNIENL